jgi:hypothetical protein
LLGWHVRFWRSFPAFQLGDVVQPGVLQALALFQVSIRSYARQLTHSAEQSLAFGDADRSPRIQNIKGVRTL